MKKTISFILALTMMLTVLFCVPFSAGAAGELKIPSGAKFYGGHAYYFYKTSTAITWKQAKKACEKRGGHLVTITSKKENDFLINYLSSFDAYQIWIGLTDEKQEGVWRWVTGEKYKYSNWCDGQPDNYYSNENYACMCWGGADKWNDFDNEQNINKFICEWDVGKVSDIKQIKATASAVTLTWKDNDYVKKYIVYYYNTATKQYEKYDTITKASITVSGLKSATTYKMAVAPVIVNNGKVQTLGKTACTVVTLPGNVTGLRIEDDVTLTWKAVKGADGYTIFLYNNTSGKWDVYKNVKKNSYNIGEKFGNKTQQFRVRAFKKSSDGKAFYGGLSGIVKR